MSTQHSESGSLTPSGKSGGIRLLAIGVMSVIAGFVSAAIAVAICGIAILKPVNYTFPIAIVVGVVTALVGFKVWPQVPHDSKTHVNS